MGGVSFECQKVMQMTFCSPVRRTRIRTRMPVRVPHLELNEGYFSRDDTLLKSDD